ncbi:MAG: TauD/TfdA dioxygenase family protein [Gammaproteobacteria bacterium]
MKVRPMVPEFGCEILDLDPRTAGQGGFDEEFRALFRQYRLLLVRGREIGATEQVRLVGLLAPVTQEGTAGEDFTLVSTRPFEYVSGRDRIPFHSDYLFTHHGPIQVVSLCALVMDLPEPTLYSSSIAAVRLLPAALRERLRRMRIVQCQTYTAEFDGGNRNRVSRGRDLPAGQFVQAEHPAIGRHPVTGEEVLLVSQSMTSHFVGLSDDDSDALFAEIERYQYCDANVLRHDWQIGDLVVWDNVALQHARPRLAGHSDRTLRRVAGNPVPVRDIMTQVKPDPRRFTYRTHAQ